MTRKTLLLLILATFAVVLLSNQAPAFTVETIQGDRIRSEDLLAKGPIFLEFWATSCEPCLKALPFISEFATKYPEMSFVAVSTDSPRNKDNVMRRVRSSRFAFTTGFDGNRTLQSLFNVSVIPRTLIITQSGQIVYDSTGYNPGDEVELEENILKVLQGEL